MSTLDSQQTNIGAAFEVVRHTYFNLEKFFKELDDVARKQGLSSLVQSNPGFLRWKSDSNVWGWMVSNFIKLYHRIEQIDEMGEESSERTYIYGLEIDFVKVEGPVVRIIRYEYNKGKKPNKSIPLSNHWVFYFPMRKKEEFEISEVGIDGISYSETKQESVNRYFGLRKTSWKTRNLAGITQQNVADLVKAFDEGW